MGLPYHGLLVSGKYALQFALSKDSSVNQSINNQWMNVNVDFICTSTQIFSVYSILKMFNINDDILIRGIYTFWIYALLFSCPLTLLSTEIAFEVDSGIGQYKGILHYSISFLSLNTTNCVSGWIWETQGCQWITQWNNSAK